MKIQARQSLLDMWRATVDYSYAKENTWEWGGRRAPNCINDAEQLLVLLYPATTITSLRLESPGDIGDDVRDALRKLGRGQPIPLAILRGTREFLLRYRDEDGNPTFEGGSYFQAGVREDTEDVKRQRRLDVVDAYSMSVTLALAVMGFSKVYRSTLNKQSVINELLEVEELASQRLSAAMVGLLRSFNVHTFDPESEPGQALLQMVNQKRTSEEAVVASLNNALDEVWVGLREGLAEGLGEDQRKLFDEFDGSSRLFECGWSWGVLDGAPRVEYATADVPKQPDGVAEARPYTYFTVTALDGIRDLFTERTRILGLLSIDQQRLARALQNRWNLTNQYWAKLATFGEPAWPLEDVPWRTTDGIESDYHTLLLTAIVSQGLATERTAGPGLRRVARLLTELAARAKITRRVVMNDPAVALHTPGMTMQLLGSEKLGDAPIEWVVSSYSMLLLKQVVQVAGLIDDSVERADLLELADSIWVHLQKRRLRAGSGQELWDSPTNLYPDRGPIPEHDRPSWYHTERTMEALVQAALTVSTEAVSGDRLSSVAEEILAEAENLLDRELLRGEHDVSEVLRTRFREMQAKLRRARELLPNRPATSVALSQQALLSIDELVAARQGATEVY